jgi:DNA-binding transcriptional MocR family regulator
MPDALPPIRQAPGAGDVLQLIRTGHAHTRAELMARTGLSRSTVAQRLEQLLAHGLIYDAGGTASTGGRPPSSFVFNPTAGVVLSAGLGATQSRLGMTDLAGDLIAEQTIEYDLTQPPDAVIAWLQARLGRLPRRRASPGGRRRARARRQRREHHGLGRALDELA